jgi:hypothetical protein
MAALIWTVTICSSSAAAPAAMQRSDEQLIRAARIRSNGAIAAHDLAGIAAVWMDEFPCYSFGAT